MEGRAGHGASGGPTGHSGDSNLSLSPTLMALTFWKCQASSLISIPHFGLMSSEGWVLATHLWQGYHRSDNVLVPSL